MEATWGALGCMVIIFLFFFPWEMFEGLWQDPEEEQVDHSAREKEFQAYSERLLKAELEKKE